MPGAVQAGKQCGQDFWPVVSYPAPDCAHWLDSGGHACRPAMQNASCIGMPRGSRGAPWCVWQADAPCALAYMPVSGQGLCRSWAEAWAETSVQAGTFWVLALVRSTLDADRFHRALSTLSGKEQGWSAGCMTPCMDDIIMIDHDGSSSTRSAVHCRRIRTNTGCEAETMHMCMWCLALGTYLYAV